MSSRKTLIADLLFVVQIIFAFLFAGAYFVRSLDDITGSSVAQFGLTLVYLAFHLALGLGAHRAKPSRLTRQAVATYAIWMALMGAVTVAAAMNPAYRWNGKDTGTIVTACALTMAVWAIGGLKKLPVADPMMKAFFAIAYKSVPQLLLAWKFLEEGASGTPGMSVVVGHVTIFVRLTQIWLMVKEAGWDRNRVWLAASESANEASWMVATVAWLVV